MLTFPGEDTNILLKNGLPIFNLPMPFIGANVTCKIYKVTPFQASARITHIEDQKCYITYRGVFRSLDILANTAEDIYVTDVLKSGQILKALIISYGENNGLILSKNF
ncbi:hypothetical protein CWI38_0201p0070 [Hamiltosporidium tvaerminnensis]|uniref:S1 motif domain-containing protein n=2 Tax=Hamiltosporidium TaxID=1176354 RepID=A0A4Q9LP03_9MICR|nr:exosome 3'->5 exonuclease subunit ski4 (Csl4) [Hamiltosporidium tvaerminnensis]TBU07715.1 hypothetical protein CWI39_0280p0030 [Hamiltosporidium magnivora]TBT99840.1 hypothetical protein CWI37_1198p0010 [Hamiltosporidium tvaerminnensis]TBU07961.1 hypothetical protein CWI39_0245p0030 [Hamiltosporidium magnivora]TBU09050.1 hypothetical protein CWI36_0068p0020 [Hamiltosporidium magnivora]